MSQYSMIDSMVRYN